MMNTLRSRHNGSLIARAALAAVIAVAAFAVALGMPQPIGAASGTVTAHIPLTQTFAAPASYAGTGTFTYTLSPLSADVEGAHHILTRNEVASLAVELPQTNGIYHFELEVVPPLNPAGYHVDTQNYHVMVMVMYTEAGYVPAVIITDEQGDKVELARFTHAYRLYATDPTLMIDPPVRKTVKGDTIPAGTVFTFTLTATDDTHPMPAGSVGRVKTITIAGAGQNEFGTWSYEAPGTYTYTVREVDAGIAGFTYDPTVYTITDTVSDIDGQLVLDRTITDATRQVDAFAFVNEYATPSPGSNQTNQRFPLTGDAARFTAIALVATTGLMIIALAVKRRRSADSEVR